MSGLHAKAYTTNLSSVCRVSEFSIKPSGLGAEASHCGTAKIPFFKVFFRQYEENFNPETLFLDIILKGLGLRHNP